MIIYVIATNEQSVPSCSFKVVQIELDGENYLESKTWFPLKVSFGICDNQETCVSCKDYIMKIFQLQLH
jgi:hypothetical protein